MGCFVRGGKNGMGCYVRADKNSMGCYVRGDKNSMGCFVRGGISLWDVLSGVSKNGMGCFVPGCFVRLPIGAFRALIPFPAIHNSCCLLALLMMNSPIWLTSLGVNYFEK